MNDEQLYSVVGGRGTVTAFEIYIKTSPSASGRRSPTARCASATASASASSPTGREGSEYPSGVPGVIDIASGENVEVDPPRRLVQTSPRSGARTSSAKAPRG